MFSICIPRIDSDVNRYKLFHIFRKMFIGRIDRIDIVTNKQTQHRRAFIHFKTLYKSEDTNNIINTLEKGEYINVVYNFPQYWKCYKSRTHQVSNDT